MLLLLLRLLVMSSEAVGGATAEVDAAQRLAEVAPNGRPVVPHAGEAPTRAAAATAEGGAGAERALEGVVAVVFEGGRVADAGVVGVGAVRPRLVMLLLLLVVRVMLVMPAAAASHGRRAMPESKRPNARGGVRGRMTVV